MNITINNLAITAALIAAFDSTALGATGSAFLKIPNGAAEIAMGQTGVSHSRGGSAIWWNPALLTRGETGGVTLQPFRWLADGRGLFGAVGVRTGFGGLGAAFFDLGTPGFETRERPGPAMGTFTLHQSLLSLAVGFKLPFNLGVGAAVKGTMEDIYGDVVYDYPLMDAGVCWSNGGWSAGISGASLELSERNRDAAPTTLRAGVSHRRSTGEVSLLSALEVSAVRGVPPGWHLGIEAGWREWFYLRGGALFTSDELRPSFGLGITAGPYSIDAAMILFDRSLGDFWRLGIGLKL